MSDRHVFDGYVTFRTAQDGARGATVRDCLDCGCLVPGGPSHCRRCAREAPDESVPETRACAVCCEEGATRSVYLCDGHWNEIMEQHRIPPGGLVLDAGGADAVQKLVADMIVDGFCRYRQCCAGRDRMHIVGCPVARVAALLPPKPEGT